MLYENGQIRTYLICTLLQAATTHKVLQWLKTTVRSIAPRTNTHREHFSITTLLIRNNIRCHHDVIITSLSLRDRYMILYNFECKWRNRLDLHSPVIITIITLVHEWVYHTLAKVCFVIPCNNTVWQLTEYNIHDLINKWVYPVPWWCHLDISNNTS